MHDVLAEDVVAELEARGFDCSFNPGGGDVDATSWSCYLGELDAGDYLNVGIASADTGPIDSMGAYRAMNSAPGAAVLDTGAAADFQVNLLPLVLPEKLRPTDEELLAGIQRNFPMELGEGWFLGFDRNSISRSIHVIYAADD